MNDEFALKIDGLNKTYDNGFVALENVNLKVKKGDFFALLGPNGAGKSTIIGIVSSLVRQTSGTVELFGYNTSTHSVLAKKHLGVVLQEYNLNGFETVQNILITQAGYFGIPEKLARPKCEFYLKQLGLWDKRNVQTLMLSGGMKRRLMVARALIHGPKLLILDEPTAGVDIELRHMLWNFIQTINNEGTTIILTTHYLEEAEQLCKNIAIIDKGKIVNNSSMNNLLGQLKTQCLILDLKAPIKKLPEMPGYVFNSSDPKTLEVSINQEVSLNQLFGLLSAAGIEVAAMRNKQNRLETLFLNLTTSI